ncbi:MAG: exodeoxyribonuclease III [Gammaproteobacteria bacterium]
MKIITLNVNGIRSAAAKGLFDWMRRQRADVVCMQETRALAEQVTDKVYHPPSLRAYLYPAERKGYSGVALYCRREPDEVIRGLGWPDFDAEGRWLEARYPGLSVISLYLPSGTSGDERQAVKMDILERLMVHLRKLRKAKREYIICGDWNIAHKTIDLKNWRSNQKNSGFLPEERSWMDELLGPTGFVDAFRVVDQSPERYTWWSNRGQAWAKNVGWRIDYQMVTPRLESRVKSASIYKNKRFSDHAPLSIVYEWPAFDGNA